MVQKITEYFVTSSEGLRTAFINLRRHLQDQGQCTLSKQPISVYRRRYIAYGSSVL